MHVSRPTAPVASWFRSFVIIGAKLVVFPLLKVCDLRRIGSIVYKLLAREGQRPQAFSGFEEAPVNDQLLPFLDVSLVEIKSSTLCSWRFSRGLHFELPSRKFSC